MKTLKQRVVLTLLFSLIFANGSLLAEPPAPLKELPDITALPEDYEAPQAIFDENTIQISGYGGPAVRVSELNNDVALFTGGKGGIIINNSLVLGGAGYGMVIPKLSDAVIPSPATATLGYGGFLMEYILFPKSLINLSVGSLIGAGNGSGNDVFFIVEPEINLFVNVTRFFKFGVSASYRWTKGLNSPPVTDETFEGFSVGLVLEFGRF